MSESMDMIYDTLELAKNGFKPKENDIRIGHSGDAITLINEMIERITTREFTYDELKNCLEALKDALDRNII